MRVLHLRSTSGLYGADRAVLALAGATPAPYAPRVLSLWRGGEEDPLVAEAHRRGLSALTVRDGGRTDAGVVRQVAAELARGGPCVLHAHDYKSLAVALAARRGGRHAVVATFHGDTGHTAAVRAYETLARALANLTHGVAAVSRELVRRLRPWVHTAPVHFLPNAVAEAPVCSEEERRQARAALGLPLDAPVVAVVGRLSPEKGHAVLLEALRQLQAPPHLLVAGDGPLAAALALKAEGLPVRWLGFVEQPRAVLAAADVVALPSFTEGLPLSALEAIWCGRPLVASSVGELPHLLGAARGLLVPPGDAAALGRALARLLASPARRAELAERARAHVSGRLTLSLMGQRYASELYAPAAQALSR